MTPSPPMGFSGRTKFSSDRLSSGLERHRAPVRRVLRWLVLSLLACLGLRYLLVLVFAPYAEQIDYGVEVCSTDSAPADFQFRNFSINATT